jgi:hypothetical protein
LRYVVAMFAQPGSCVGGGMRWSGAAARARQAGEGPPPLKRPFGLRQDQLLWVRVVAHPPGSVFKRRLFEPPRRESKLNLEPLGFDVAVSQS